MLLFENRRIHERRIGTGRTWDNDCSDGTFATLVDRGWHHAACAALTAAADGSSRGSGGGSGRFIPRPQRLCGCVVVSVRTPFALRVRCRR